MSINNNFDEDSLVPNIYTQSGLKFKSPSLSNLSHSDQYAGSSRGSSDDDSANSMAHTPSSASVNAKFASPASSPDILANAVAVLGPTAVDAPVSSTDS